MDGAYLPCEFARDSRLAHAREPAEADQHYASDHPFFSRSALSISAFPRAVSIVA